MNKFCKMFSFFLLPVLVAVNVMPAEAAPANKKVKVEKIARADKHELLDILIEDCMDKCDEEFKSDQEDCAYKQARCENSCGGLPQNVCNFLCAVARQQCEENAQDGINSCVATCQDVLL